MPFEVFAKEMARTAGDPFISIQRNGIIALNRSAFALLGEPEAVELLYDRDAKRVGVRSCDAKAPNGHAVRAQNSRGSSFVVTATLFTRHYGIETDTARRWAATFDGGVLTIDLTKPPVAETNASVSAPRRRGAPRQK
jgi:hypothetical protein